MSMSSMQFPTPFASLLRSLGMLVCVATCTLSCSVLIDTKSEQCRVDADCTSRGVAFANTTCDLQQNVCVAGLGCAETPNRSNDTVLLSFAIEFLTPPKEPKSTIVRVCGGSADFHCDSPIGDPITVSYGEVAAVPVPTGYQGVIEVKNPDALPALYYLGRPIPVDTHGYDLTLSTPGTAVLLGLATHQDVDPNLGIVVITARDCARQPLSNVAVMSDFTGAIQFYFQNKTPQPSLTLTTAEGAAGYANVPEGFVSIGGTLNGRPLTGSAGAARNGWVTYMELFP
ncbi:MAG: hypothetical protein ABIQ16_12370 [Polyangiaceae bacterium]